jgi:hypothetical protein
MTAPRSGGGTSIPEKTSSAPWIAFVVTAVIGAWLVHQISSEDECGWNYAAVGGACRAIILLSVISGAFAGACVAGAMRARAQERGRRAAVLAALAIAALVLGTLAAQQFEDYRAAVLHRPH